jgi:hypothetical protein
MPPARLQAIGAALEIIPLLPDDVVAYKIAGIDCHALHLVGPPSADLFDQIMNVTPEHCCRLKRHGDIHPRDTTHRSHISRNRDVPPVIGGAGEAADLS